MQATIKKFFVDDRITIILLVALFFVIGVSIAQVAQQNYWLKAKADAMCFKTCQERLAKEAANKTKTTTSTKKTTDKNIINLGSIVTQKNLKGNYGNFIVIELSRTCQALLKANLSTTCPSYKDLEKYDTTNKKISGKIEYINGEWKRGKPSYNNYQLSYQPSKYPLVVCVDCSGDILQRSPKIIIEQGEFVYKKNTDNTMKNFTRYEYKNRYVDKDCQTAMIPYIDFLLNDTINYLHSGCKTTKYNATNTIHQKPIPIGDLNSYQSYKNQKSMAEKIKQAKLLAEEYCKKPGSKC